MTQIELSVVTSLVIKELCIGSILSCGGSGPFENAPSADWAGLIWLTCFKSQRLSQGLGIPLLYRIDGVHGNYNVFGATIFPHNVGLGATRSDECVNGRRGGDYPVRVARLHRASKSKHL
ncbi:beta-D-xylosidase 3 [Tanacetum coccineum]